MKTLSPKDIQDSLTKHMLAEKFSEKQVESAINSIDFAKIIQDNADSTKLVYIILDEIECWWTHKDFDNFPELVGDFEKEDTKAKPFTFRRIGKKTVLYLPKNLVLAYKSPLVSMLVHLIAVDEKYQIIHTDDIDKCEEGHLFPSLSRKILENTLSTKGDVLSVSTKSGGVKPIDKLDAHFQCYIAWKVIQKS